MESQTCKPAVAPARCYVPQFLSSAVVSSTWTIVPDAVLWLSETLTKNMCNKSFNTWRVPKCTWINFKYSTSWAKIALWCTDDPHSLGCSLNTSGVAVSNSVVVKGWTLKLMLDFLQVWLTTLVFSFSTQVHGDSTMLEFWHLDTQWTGSWLSLQMLKATQFLESVLHNAPAR